MDVWQTQAIGEQTASAIDGLGEGHGCLSEEAWLKNNIGDEEQARSLPA